MPLAKIRLFPDIVLRKKSEAVSVFSHEVARIFKTLDKTMEAQPSGIGIAAPQIGILKRLVVVDVSSRDPKAKRLYLANPEILEAKNPVPSREGCMSLPEYTAPLKRFDWIRVRWQDHEGKFCENTTSGIEAICIQHEVDHLNGILFFDRVAALKTDMIPRRMSSRKE